MKTVFMILVSCLALTLSVVAPARAQLPGTEIRVNIPFAFTVRGKLLPAGNYEIRRVTDAPDTLELYNRPGHQTVVFETEPVQSKMLNQKGELVFHRYGNDYFLSEIWTSSESIGRELRPSHAERRLEREMAKANSKPETVALAVD